MATPAQKKLIIEAKKARLDFDKRIAQEAAAMLSAAKRDFDMDALVSIVRARLNPVVVGSIIR